MMRTAFKQSRNTCLSMIITLFLYLLFSSVTLNTVKAQTGNFTISFEDLFSNRFSARSVNSVRWMKEGRFFSSLTRNNGDIELRQNDIITGRFKVLVKQSELITENGSTPIIIEGYQFSADEQKLLIETNVETIWRRSTKADYYVYTLEDKSLKKLSDSDQKLQYAEFSPKGDRVAFVRDNNLFWVNLNSGTEHQITEDGKKGKVINGASDWVYEEEFSFAKAWFWSPDGQKIAFYRFDESEVRQYTLQEWNGIYPETVPYKYPKAGEQNSDVTIGVYHIGKDSTVWMDTGSTKDQYIVRLDWTHDPDKLSIRRMNRLQNSQDLLIADALTGEATLIKTETNDAWIEENDDLTFLKNGNEFIYVSEEDGYNHIYHYRIDGKLIRQVTTGNWDVTKFVGFNERSNLLYYVSTEESPLERHLYQIQLNGQQKKRLTEGKGWHNINMNPGLTYYIDNYSRADTPPVVTLYDNNAEPVRHLIKNDGLNERISKLQLPQKEFIKIPVNGGNVTLNGYMIKPADFDSQKKYPVLMYVYGGPGSQLVTNRYSGGQRETWHRYLAERGYLIVAVDNRGTGGRGADFKKIIYKNLGDYESRDQIATAEYLKSQPYVDDERIGIWGWSYGGYMSSLSLTRGNNAFKMAIAVAPVTDWRFYDTIYTERYMQTPQKNPVGYESSSVLNEVEGMKGKKYLLIHGSGDDNVHVQNTLELIDALVEQDISFQTMIYPDRAHSIAGGNTRRHLYRLMSDFIMENL